MGSVLASTDQLVIIVDAYGNNAARHHIGKVFQRSLLDGALAGGEEDELAVLFQVAHRQDGADIFALLQVEQAGHGLAFARSANVRDLIHFEPIDAAGVGEAEQIRVVESTISWETKSSSRVFMPSSPSATSPVLAVNGNRRALAITRMRNSDSDLFVRDQILGDSSAVSSRICVRRSSPNSLRAASSSLMMTERSFACRGQNRFILCNALAHFNEFFENLVRGKLGETVELQFKDGVDLAIGQARLSSGPVTTP